MVILGYGIHLSIKAQDLCLYDVEEWWNPELQLQQWLALIRIKHVFPVFLYLQGLRWLFWFFILYKNIAS